jgi:glycosyltransferase involved in cell wall biosynthesis
MTLDAAIATVSGFDGRRWRAPAKAAGLLRILHFAETLVGGPASYLNELLPFQVKTYGEVWLFCPADQRHLIKCDGVRTIGFSDYTRSFAGLVRLFQSWRALTRNTEFDIIHLHSSFAGAIGRLDVGPRRSKVLYCPHGWSFGMDCHPLLRVVYAVVERVLSGRSDTIVNISMGEQELARMAGLPAQKLRMVHNGIRDVEWRPLKRGKTAQRLLFVGRYDRQKGIDLLLEAMEELRHDGYSLNCIGAPVVGKPAVEAFPSCATDLGWQAPERVREAIADADLIVVPSRWEGFGLVVAEAMRAARPVAATAVGGLTELVVDGESGVLYRPGSPQAIIDAVRRVGAMDIRQLGINARRRYESMFTAGQMVQGINRLYLELAP